MIDLERAMGPMPRLPSTFAVAIVRTWSSGGRWHALFKHIADHLPGESDLAILLDTAFYASLTKEESRPARFSFALYPPSFLAAHRIQDRPLTVTALSKLSAACDWDATLLYVWLWPNGWRIWGVGVNDRPPQRSSTAQSQSDHLVVTVREAGVISLRWRHLVVFSYAHGDGTVAGSDAIAHSDIETIVAESLPAPSPTTLMLIHLSAICRCMRAHGRGGALLIVPNASPPKIQFGYPIERWPADYPIAPYLEAPLAQAVAYEDQARRQAATMKDEVVVRDHIHREAVEGTEEQCALIGRLTAIDGIVVLNHAMELKGFGGKIPVPEDFGATQLLHIDPRDGSRSTRCAKDVFSGMRHYSGAMACSSQPGSLVLIQSQDGPLTVIMHRADGALWVIRPLDRLLELYER